MAVRTLSTALFKRYLKRFNQAPPAATVRALSLGLQSPEEVERLMLEALQ